MLDFNRILLFVAFLSPLVVLARTWRRAALNRGWQGAAVVVLVVTALGWIVAPRAAGFIGGGAWLVLLLIPAAGLRKAAKLGAQHRYTSARRIVSLLRFVHPVAALRDERSLLVALEFAVDGRNDEALDILEKLARNETRAAVSANALIFRIRGDWDGLLGWCRKNLPLVALGRDPGLLPLYLRALGETGLRDELVLQFAGRAPALLASPATQATFDASLMVVLAFSGRTSALARLFKMRLRKMPRDAQEFWLATSESSRARLERLHATTADALLRADSLERLHRLEPPPALTPINEATVRRFERHAEARRGSLLAPSSGMPTLVVLIFIALNAAMFLAEIALGGATNLDTLHRLGALEPQRVLRRAEYWRLVSALFLHYGALHLAFNSYALYVLGPPLEGSIGRLRFAITYLAAGLGSSAGVVALWAAGWTQADFLVGASGSVMGIVGAWAGLLLRHRDAPMARRRLLSVGLIVVMQTAFDFYTPQVSMAAHLCGLLSGLIIGLVVAPPRKALSETAAL